jgi:hypothetical protein
MEKYGVEKEKKVRKKRVEMTESAKLAGLDSNECEHPAESILIDGDTKFCDKCGVYLKGKKK